MPAAIDGRKVTSMSSQPSDDVVGFAGAGIQTLTLPATLVCIEAQAFENNDIATLQLPDSVRVVATGAFARNRISTLSVAEAGDGVGAPFLVQSPSLTVTRDAFGDWLPLSELLEWDIDGKSTEWTVADTPALPDGVGYDADRRAFRIDDSITSFTFAATMTDGHSIGSALIQYTVTIAAAAPTSGGAPSSPTGVPAPLPLDADVPATGESGS
ncbi:hypothetical protein [Microbacterium sp. AG790]|uniref:hypothetical protein n=1 Tax=Microbacterium sp. AG790 TaxID=2183995 RepID=UPI0011C4975C|nr:hypothetical protein [Microbacterium sp. AG790]